MSSVQHHTIEMSDSVDTSDAIFPAAQRYTHEPLQTHDSIRVLELLPGSSGSALSCRILEIHRENSDVEFEAISYVWGSPVPACFLREIESNTMLRITENLFLALRALRYRDRSRILWADAICINQSDNDEKSHQVKNMGPIYATAATVNVWLGNEDVGEALKTLQDHEEAMEHGRPTAEPNGPIDSVMAAVFNIVGTQWFTRLWIIQEFVLAREVHFWAGNQHIDYKTLENALEDRRPQYQVLRDCLPGDSSLWQLVLSLRESMNGHTLASNLFSFRNRWYSQLHPGFSQLSPYDCCRSFHGQRPNCTDERDLIYALLGLARTPHKIVPNYNLNVTGVFLDFTWSEMENGNINILRDADFLRQDGSYPSFVYRPDFNNKHIDMRFGVNAAGKSRAISAEAIRPASIQIRGVIVDRIGSFWQPPRRLPSEADHQQRRMRSSHQSLEDFLLSAEVLSSSDEHLTDPNGLLHNLGTDNPAQVKTTNLLEVYRNNQAYAKRIINQDPTRKDLTPKRLRDRFWRIISSLPEPKDFRCMPRDYVWEPFHSNMFTTSRGYMGKAFGRVMVDDLVVIFDGGDVPFVIRKAHSDSGIRWRLVSECYVDGWMDGSYYSHEVVDDSDQACTAADAETNTDPLHRKRTLVSEYFVLC